MIQVHTRWPVATDSVDHTHPRGTKNDDSRNPEFVTKLARFIATPRVLDLGCSGGGFVDSILNAGDFAIGIEGSDFSKKVHRASWRHLANTHLFTADIGKPFLVLEDGALGSFNVVTMWEVLEHIGITQLEGLISNVHAHLVPGGFLIASINTGPDSWEGHEYHQTIRPTLWWVDFFIERGFRAREDVHSFFDPNWVRGPNTEGSASTCFVFQK